MSAQRTTAGGSVDRGTGGAPGSYNNFWLDRGTRIIGTSLGLNLGPSLVEMS